MASETQQIGSSGVPPGRPPPPYYPSAPPPYCPPGVQLAGPVPAGVIPYCAPPPGAPYSSPPPAYQEGYPTGHPLSYPPSGQIPAPPVCHGGNALYPDISQLPQPEAVPLGFTHRSESNSGTPLQPVLSSQPAPAAPTHGAPSFMGSPGPDPIPLGQGQTSVGAEHVPPGCVIAWRGGEGLKVFFVQQEGHVVSPKIPLMLNVYKKIGGTPCTDDSNLMGMVEVPGCWQLELTGKTTYVLHSSGNVYIFQDKTTGSKRAVVLQLPSNVTKTMEADLLALINELTDLRNEEEGVVDKITTGVSTVYTDITKKINTAVKETVPGAHKSTKWLRKGTGNLVRMGGNLVSKGMHLIADHVPTSEQPQEDSPVHTELLAALKQLSKSKGEGSITYT
ncbi:hypothetical protein OTU49_000553 [Cherax quadricarinatus]|uniref:Uncharacterized protein n=2 Tax=Cherax quadricarinatus TaxID=27406 RepID=A0AAW0XJE1_CHEQU